MRKYKRALVRAKANRLSKYGRNGKSIALFRMMWAGEQEAAHKGTIESKKVKAKAKQDKKDNALKKAIKNAKERLMGPGIAHPALQ